MDADERLELGDRIRRMHRETVEPVEETVDTHWSGLERLEPGE